MSGQSIYFITKGLRPRLPALGQRERDLVVSTLRYCVREGDVELGAFVVLPDHWHALVRLRGNWDLPKLMAKVMRYVSGRSLSSLWRHGAKWQDGYYESEIRSRENFYRVRDYIHGNPVVRGLVALPEEWEQSSAYPAHSGWATTLVWPI